MATPNYVAGSSGDGGDSIFDVVRRKLGKVQDVIQGMAAPLKRRSMYDELPEHSWPPVVPEVIEMSALVQRGEGHTFVSCQLSNPTWCDYCGDFIWGLYKQCMRCQTCQYTCHQHCVPAVNLNCKSIQDDSAALLPQAPTPAAAPSPAALGRHGNGSSNSSATVGGGTSRPRLEPSRSLGQLSSRPGGATRLLPAEGPSGGGVSAGQLQHPLQQEDGTTKTPPPSSSLSQQRHLSRSASEGFVQPQGSLQERTVSSSSTPADRQGKQGSPSTPRRPDTPPPPASALRQSPLHQATPPRDSPGEVSGHKGRPEGETTSDVATEKDETDSGYRSGTIPEDKLPPVPSQATLDRQELKRKITKYNHFVPAASFEVMEKETYQGFVKVTMNLIRPITMELGARPPSIYELLTREHIVEENTQHVAFYMPRDTHKSLHITSETTTKEVVTSLLKKFHILDHPRKFAMYDQEFNDKNKLVRLRRLNDKDFPLRAILDWDPERIRNYRLVLQENETGEIVWDAFSLPELNNFLRVLDREETETISELKHKYSYMRQYMKRRLVELRGERRKSKA